MKYHPLCITRWIFPYLQGNFFHIFNRCHKIIWILFQIILKMCLGNVPKMHKHHLCLQNLLSYFSLYQFQGMRRREGGGWGRIECQVDDEIFLRQHFGVVGHVLEQTSDFEKVQLQQKVGWGTRLAMYDVLVIWMNNVSHS